MGWGDPEPRRPRPPRARPFVYRGPRVWTEGIPFGSWTNPGDAYVSSTPIDPGDADLLDILEEVWGVALLPDSLRTEIEALLALARTPEPTPPTTENPENFHAP